MEIQNRSLLKKTARQRLSSAENGAKIALFYASVIVGASLLVNAVRYFLGVQISGAGGLSNLRFRSSLSTLRSMLPIVLNFLLMCLGLGFTGSMLRISRNQPVSLQGLKIGFARFWVLLRVTLLQGALYMMAMIAAYMISMQIFFLTPLSKGLLSALAPYMNSSTQDVMVILENPAVMEQLAGSMIPLYGIMIVLALAISAPIYYGLILTKYLILDHPSMGALAAMSLSRQYMKKKRMLFFKLDLSLWPYYISTFLAAVVLYGSTILTLLGVELPISPLMLSLICFLGHMALTFVITLFLQPHAEVTHALAYEALCPAERSSGGVVLGNIFDLARDQMNEQ